MRLCIPVLHQYGKRRGSSYIIGNLFYLFTLFCLCGLLGICVLFSFFSLQQSSLFIYVYREFQDFAAAFCGMGKLEDDTVTAA
jgi:hypothetical protein